MSTASTSAARVNVLLYSNNKYTREAVRMAVGRRVASDLPVIEWRETATEWATTQAMDAGGIDLLIADGESAPGGMGLCRQYKNEIFECPPVVVITGRPEDAWLAAWSQADAAVPAPIDPLDMAGAVEDVLRPVLTQRALAVVDPLS